MGKKLALIAAGLLGLIAACNKKTETNFVPVQVNPLVAHYEDMNNSGKKVILEDHLQGNLGNLIVFDTQSGNTNLLLRALPQDSYRWLRATTQTKAVLYEWDYSIQPSNSDIVVADLDGGAHFDSNTPDKDEYFLKMVNNDQTALYEEYDWLFHISRIMSVDVNTHETKDLFASERVVNINHNDNNLRVFTEDIFGNNKFYLIDSSGAKQLLLTTGPGNNIEHYSTPEAAAYYDYPNIVFKLLGTGATATFVPPSPDPSISYYVQGMTQAEAVMCGYDITGTNPPAFYHFDFATQTTTPIDLSAFPNWDGRWNEMVNGAGRLAIPGNDNVLFYNRASGTIEDLVTPVIGATPIYSQVIAKSGGKALIRTERNADQNYIGKALYFDGTNVADAAPSYNDVRVRDSSKDGKYVLLMGGYNDLVLFDVEAGTSKVIYNGFPRSPRFSPDSSIVVYAAYVDGTNETVVNVYDIAAKTTRELSRKPSMSQIYDISKDNSTVIIGRDYSIFAIDTATGDETFVAYE
ncbi:MAG: hypothetical protein QXM31_03160 [Candidatus Woesearchaeota archaeon]